MQTTMLPSAHAEAKDLAIQGTNNSSITSKRSAERLGYFEHCHIQGVTSRDSPLMLKHVVPRPVRRSPVINRAYFMRTEGIRRIIERWMEDCEALGVSEYAIINLGCGFDPTFFRLQAIAKEKTQRGASGPTRLRFVDIDYPALITEKLYMARTNPELAALLPTDARIDDVGQLVSDVYSCLGVDLRQLDQLAHALEQAGITPQANRPTLIISEVVLAYLAPEDSDAVLGFFSRFPRATFVLHEQCVPAFDHPQDRHQGQNLHPFAATMYTHFDRTMTSLKTLRSYPGMEDQAARLERLGWAEGHILNMNLFEDKVVLADPSLRRRIATLEPFDEFDEMHWIGTYYFMAIATTPATSPSDPSPNVVKALGLSLTLQALGPSPGCFTQWPVTATEPTTPAAQQTRMVVGTARWTPTPPLASIQLRRKGHSLCILGDHAYIFGGFGEDSVASSNNSPGLELESTTTTTTFQPRSQQGRLNSMVVCNLVTGEHRVSWGMDDASGSHTSLNTIISSNSSASNSSSSNSSSNAGNNNNSSMIEWPAARMYHATVESLDGTAFYMYGGRDGPTKVHNDVWRFSPSEGWSQLWRAKSVCEGGFDSAYPKAGLYKHTLTMMTLAGGREMMVLIGGRNSQGDANDQIWAFDPVDSQWAQFKWRPGVSPASTTSSSSSSSSPSSSPSDSPCSSPPSLSDGHLHHHLQQQHRRWQGLFSHSATVVTDDAGQQSLLVYGGIRGKGERVLNKLWRVTLEIEDETFTCWADATPIPLHHAAMHPHTTEGLGGDLLTSTTNTSTSSSSSSSSSSHHYHHHHWTPKARFSHIGVPIASNKIWLLGGVSDPALLQWHETVAEIVLADDGASASYRELAPSAFKDLVMVNHAVAIDRARGRIVGVGGGGVCFGFGGWFDGESWGLAID